METITETAKKIRARLKELYPDLPKNHFSVKTSKSDSTIYVLWEDYPSRKEVVEEIDVYRGLYFDGSIDSDIYTGYVDPKTNERISSHNRISYSKTISETKYNQVYRILLNTALKKDITERDVYDYCERLDNDNNIVETSRLVDFESDSTLRKKAIDKAMNIFKNKFMGGRYLYPSIHPIYLKTYFNITTENHNLFATTEEWASIESDLRNVIVKELNEYSANSGDLGSIDEFLKKIQENAQFIISKTNKFESIMYEYKAYIEIMASQITKNLKTMFNDDDRINESDVYHKLYVEISSFNNNFAIHRMRDRKDISDYYISELTELYGERLGVSISTMVGASFDRIYEDSTEFKIYSPNRDENVSALVLLNSSIVLPESIRVSNEKIYGKINPLFITKDLVVKEVTNELSFYGIKLTDEKLDATVKQNIQKSIERLVKNRTGDFTNNNLKEEIIREALSEWIKETNPKTIPNDILKKTIESITSNDKFQNKFIVATDYDEFKHYTVKLIKDLYAPRTEINTVNTIINKLLSTEVEYLKGDVQRRLRVDKLMNKSEGLGLGVQPFSAQPVNLGFYYSLNKSSNTEIPHMLLKGTEENKYHVLVFPYIAYLIYLDAETQGYKYKIIYSVKSQTILEAQKDGMRFAKNLPDNMKNIFLIAINNLSLK